VGGGDLLLFPPPQGRESPLSIDAKRNATPAS
jgi:hypothetical protein